LIDTGFYFSVFQGLDNFLGRFFGHWTDWCYINQLLGQKYTWNVKLYRALLPYFSVSVITTWCVIDRNNYQKNPDNHFGRITFLRLREQAQLLRKSTGPFASEVEW